MTGRTARDLCPAFLRPVARRLRSVAVGVRGASAQPAEVFTEIYRGDGFHGTAAPVDEGASASGPGSGLEQTARIRAEIPELLSSIGARSILDAPCGDFHWMKECDLGVDQYIGMDIVEDLVSANEHAFGAAGRRFVVGDVIADQLPTVDVILCRDCLVHLKTPQVFEALENFVRSGSAYLLTTTFPEARANRDLQRVGQWRPIDLTKPPFQLPPPLRLINEGCTEDEGRYADKSLGLWRIEDVARAVHRGPSAT